jgi:hypothetical protein
VITVSDSLRWRKSRRSAQGNCVEVAWHDGRVLVRDTQDHIGPVLRFSLAAWRRFAGQVKRPLASGPAEGPDRRECVQGALWCLGRSLRCVWSCFLAGQDRRGLGCRRGGVLGSSCAGAGVVGESWLARGARPRGLLFPCLAVRRVAGAEWECPTSSRRGLTGSAVKPGVGGQRWIAALMVRRRAG